MDTEGAGWIDWIDGLREVAKSLFEGARASGPGFRESDLALKMFGTMMGAYLSHLSADPNHPAFLPSAGYYSMYGSPNPDTVYRSALIDDTGRYVITGRMGTSRDVTIMPFGAATPKGLETFSPFDLAQLTLGKDGAFEVVLSRERPGSAGNWWRLEPGMRSLMLRSVSSDWAARADPVLAITRQDVDPRRTRIDNDALRQRVDSFAYVVQAMIKSGITRVTQLRSDGVVNQVVAVDYSAGGGLVNQWYHEGCFELAEDEALIVEAHLLEECQEFSLSLTDAFFSTLDWANAQSSLNQRQAAVEPDRVLRIVVTSNDPGVQNWLDTLGHQFGVLQFRWMGGHEAPRIMVKKISSGSVREAFPTTTGHVNADERVAAIRERQIGAQLRSLW